MAPAPVRDQSRRVVTVGACLVLLGSLVSFTPSGLYHLYERDWGLSAPALGVMFAAYPLAVLSTLLLVGSLGDRAGRVRVLRVAAVLLALALVVLAFAPGPRELVIGRVASGVASALISGAGGSLLLESHPGGVHAGSVLNGLAVSLGCGIGPGFAGLVATHLPAPRTTPFLVVLALQAAIGSLLMTLPVDGPPRGSPNRGGVVRLAPVQVPRAIRAPFFLAASAILVTNLSLATFATFGDRIAGSLRISVDRSGALISGVFLAMALTQFLARRATVRVSLVAGALTLAGGWIWLSMAESLGAPTAWALVGPLLLAVGGGLLLVGSMSLIGHVAPPDRRAEVYSAYLVIGFATLAVSALALGPAFAALPVGTVVLVLTAAIALLSSGILMGALRLRDRT